MGDERGMEWRSRHWDGQPPNGELLLARCCDSRLECRGQQGALRCPWQVLHWNSRHNNEFHTSSRGGEKKAIPCGRSALRKKLMIFQRDKLFRRCYYRDHSFCRFRDFDNSLSSSSTALPHATAWQFHMWDGGCVSRFSLQATTWPRAELTMFQPMALPSSRRAKSNGSRKRRAPSLSGKMRSMRIATQNAPQPMQLLLHPAVARPSLRLTTC
jgi:hypothetical protein